MNLTFIGNLSKDPDLKYAASGTPYCFFSLAMNTHKKTDPKNKTIWWNCVAFGETAEEIAISFKKGKAIEVVKANIELTKDSRDDSDKMQVKVWEVKKPTYDDKAKQPAQKDEKASEFKDEDVPF